jgi:hypothetical protein
MSTVTTGVRLVTCSAARVACDPTVMSSRAREALAGAFVGRPWRDTQITDPRDRLWWGLSGEWRYEETESSNDRVPDQPHGHLGGGRLAGV